MNLLKYSYQSINIDNSHFTHYLNELREHRAWEKVPVDEPYGSEDAMLKGEIGKRLAEIEVELDAAKRELRKAKAGVIDDKDQENKKRQPHGGDRRSDAIKLYDKNNDVQLDKAPTGNRREAMLRRLRADRPDIHARVLAGEITAHAGMVEAGFRKRSKSRKQTPLDQLRKVWAKASAHEREMFKADICGMLS